MARYYCGRIDGESWFGVGSSDVIRWDDVMEVQGHAISVAKAINLGIENDLEIAHKLKKDLQSDTGCPAPPQPPARAQQPASGSRRDLGTLQWDTNGMAEQTYLRLITQVDRRRLFPQLGWSAYCRYFQRALV
jgi:hypothetical protein